MRNDPKLPRDPDQLAKRIIDIATGEKPDDVRDATPERARSGASRASNMTPEQRAEAARLAAQARWRKKG